MAQVERRWRVRVDEDGPVLWMFNHATDEPVEAFQASWSEGGTWADVLDLDDLPEAGGEWVPVRCSVCGEDPCVFLQAQRHRIDAPPSGAGSASTLPALGPVAPTLPRPPAPPLWWALEDAVAALVRAGAPQGDILDEIDRVLEVRR